MNTKDARKIMATYGVIHSVNSPITTYKPSPDCGDIRHVGCFAPRDRKKAQGLLSSLELIAGKGNVGFKSRTGRIVVRCSI